MKPGFNTQKICSELSQSTFKNSNLNWEKRTYTYLPLAFAYVRRNLIMPSFMLRFCSAVRRYTQLYNNTLVFSTTKWWNLFGWICEFAYFVVKMYFQTKQNIRTINGNYWSRISIVIKAFVWYNWEWVYLCLYFEILQCIYLFKHFRFYGNLFYFCILWFLFQIYLITRLYY